jgi:hypothetical protein
LTFKAKIPYQGIVPPFEKSVLHTVTQAFYPIPLSLAHRVDRRILNDCLLRKILCSDLRDVHGFRRGRFRLDAE